MNLKTSCLNPLLCGHYKQFLSKIKYYINILLFLLGLLVLLKIVFILLLTSFQQFFASFLPGFIIIVEKQSR